MSNNYTKFITSTHAGKALLKKYALSQEGVWQVLGEDPNCDFSGPHYQPTLGFYAGKLKDVIYTAVDLPNFWTWGGGGDILPIVIKPANSHTLQKADSLIKKKLELENELNKITKELADL